MEMRKNGLLQLLVLLKVHQALIRRENMFLLQSGRTLRVGSCRALHSLLPQHRALRKEKETENVTEKGMTEEIEKRGETGMIGEIVKTGESERGTGVIDVMVTIAVEVRTLFSKDLLILKDLRVLKCFKALSQ